MIRSVTVRTGIAIAGLAALMALAVLFNARGAIGFHPADSFDGRLAVVAVPGYHVSVFTTATAAQKVSNPDSAVVDGAHVFIDYQNVTSKTGGAGQFSTVVEYNMEGDWLKSWQVPGHSDGMRVNPADHVIWTTSNEDGNAQFATINTKTDAVTSYTFPPAPHGGGYDDLYFLGGKAFVAASNPVNLDASGVNTNDAVDQITLNPDHTITLTSVLKGNAAATNTNTGAATTLNLSDPDSLSTDGKGNLVLVSQGDSLLVTISNPGTTNTPVAALTVGTQPDDTVYPSGMGRLLVVDAGGTTYWISKDTAFAAGSIYTQAPNDSGVTNFVGTVNPTTGLITPLAIGFTKTTGMVFVPTIQTTGDSQNSGD
ncbi:MAG TPA: hypothetical protein VGG90_10140 [Candidatus Dormibacteraeota bacterium]